MLHRDEYGQGPELVLLHGWGMHGGLLRIFAEQLGEYFHVSVVDLPGHGNSDWDAPVSLNDWARQVLDCTPQSACWIGWSLGGLVALAAAQRAPQRLQGLMLMASTPKFVTAPDWSCAIEKTIFEQFASNLEADAMKTLARFLSLQVRSSEQSSELLRQLRHELKQRPPAEAAALRTGLEFLQETDLRKQLGEADVPLFGVFGERDTLVPASVAALFEKDHSVVVEGAGHTPFLSHPDVCVEVARRWFGSDDGVANVS
ncbi:carboxylesterase BioH (pimeloyl-CoA synthesis) [Thiogranum longum]|uniref:Pimeloyl-[acyl-carrier protein] methyl ester esterase n=1 Tax=Thiogranum longum TaxID=1537524 RepID=A0A4R1HAB5_9GAMM|nr:pimeloyl-ACP methyl ester esterase BioH [Thiogranum longum]TCK17070.1 carboxylesterase BioH (pimeloyl-CoA synthesis) [Thiogranum longum]